MQETIETIFEALNYYRQEVEKKMIGFEETIDKLEVENEALRELGKPIAHIVRAGTHELAKLIDVHTTDPEKDALVAFCDYYALPK